MFDKKKLEAELILADITRASLAKELGIDKSTLYKKMNGKTEWTLSEIQKIGDVLGGEKIHTIFFAKEVS